MSSVTPKSHATPPPQPPAKGTPRAPIRTGVKAGVWDPHVAEKVHDGGDIWR